MIKFFRKIRHKLLADQPDRVILAGCLVVAYNSYGVKNNFEIDSSLVIIGGMYGTGAKDLFTANLVLANENKAFMYQKVKTALGSRE